MADIGVSPGVLVVACVAPSAVSAAACMDASVTPRMGAAMPSKVVRRVNEAVIRLSSVGASHARTTMLEIGKAVVSVQCILLSDFISFLHRRDDGRPPPWVTA